ncbi:MAG: Holliday junction branch migration protein RuvA [Flavobacteriaceae bacterium]|nr:Holliday junction branch migration protein RuvA [Flavobacteriaceae bacterium]|tara:strand:- start:4265 stop:4843 length:579 start_codon:yes stop_codon:yes gene_type:complete
MITQIKGRLIEKSPTELVIDCNGIGYSVNISLHTYSKLSNEENIKLFTYLIIKEDSHSLFGFITKAERELFQLLISVSGVGASTARVMLSSLSPSEIVSAIANEKVSIVQSIKGIGSKTAQRIILELKDKILGIENNENDFELIPQEIEEAISALEVLGYSRKYTTKLVSKIKSDEPEISTEALIKRSLNNL